MKFIVFNPETNEQSFFNLMTQLRPHIALESFRNIVHAAQAESNYQLIGLLDNNELVALMGYRVLTDFVHGRHLYVDDLVTNQKIRSKGFGARMLQQAEVIAQENGCSNLRLSTGIDNERGKEFYLKNGWNLRAIVLKKKL